MRGRGFVFHRYYSSLAKGAGKDFRAGGAVAYVESVTCLCLALFSLRLLPRFAFMLVTKHTCALANKKILLNIMHQH